jgi:hypothetical protein
MRLVSGLGLLALLTLVGAFFSLGPEGADKSAGVATATIGAAEFVYPVAFARDEATAAGGGADRLAFITRFPDFSPPRADANQRSLARGFDKNLVLISVSAKDDSLDPKDRPSRLYARFLESGASVGPEGLVMRRFQQGSPYDLEQLYIAPPDGRAFFARCPSRADETPAQDFCLFVFREDNLDVELRFAPALLEHWEALSEGVHAFLARIRVGAQGAPGKNAG